MEDSTSLVLIKQKLAEVLRDNNGLVAALNVAQADARRFSKESTEATEKIPQLESGIKEGTEQKTQLLKSTFQAL